MNKKNIKMEVTYKSGYIRFYYEDEVHAVDQAHTLLTFNMESPETVIISGLMGKWSKEHFDSVIGYFKDNGCERVMAHVPTKFKPKDFEPWNEMHILDLKNWEKK